MYIEIVCCDRMTLIIQAKKAGSHIEHVSVLDVVRYKSAHSFPCPALL
jgi:hypothetical protein